jgi:hypothetical protein
LNIKELVYKGYKLTKITTIHKESWVNVWKDDVKVMGENRDIKTLKAAKVLIDSLK